MSTANFAQAQEVATDAPWSVRMAESVMERNPEFMERWHYEVGVMLKAFHERYERTGEEKYWDYVKYNMDRYVQPDGSIRTYEMSDYNLDQINAGKLFFPLYEATGDERYRKAADTLRDQLHGHPRASEGGFWPEAWTDLCEMWLAEYGLLNPDAHAAR